MRVPLISVILASDEGFVPGGELGVDAGGGQQGIASSFDNEVVAVAVEAGLEFVVGTEDLEGGGGGDRFLNGSGGEGEIGVVKKRRDGFFCFDFFRVLF